MTDYSELSDAEIAERVCVKLGAPPVISDGYPDINRWVKKMIPMFNQSWVMGFGVPCTYEEAVLRKYTYICFDWTAPIMMQKVKEWLVGRGHLIEIFYHVSKNWGVEIVEITDEIINDKENRALYEAFLQVEE